MGRGLLKGFEQRVGGGVGQLVNLIDQIDLEAGRRRGGIVGALAQVADVVDAAVGGGVDLDQVEGGFELAGVGVRQVPRLVGRRVDRAGQDPADLIDDLDRALSSVGL